MYKKVDGNQIQSKQEERKWIKVYVICFWSWNDSHPVGICRISRIQFSLLFMFILQSLLNPESISIVATVYLQQRTHRTPLHKAIERKMSLPPHIYYMHFNFYGDKYRPPNVESFRKSRRTRCVCISDRKQGKRHRHTHIAKRERRDSVTFGIFKNGLSVCVCVLFSVYFYR